MYLVHAVVVIKDDDFGFEDDVLGVTEIDFATAQFVKQPRVPQQLSVKLMAGDALGNVADVKVGPLAGLWNTFCPFETDSSIG